MHDKVGTPNSSDTTAETRRIRSLLITPMVGAVVGMFVYAMVAIQTGAWQLWIPVIGLGLAIIGAWQAYRVASRASIRTVLNLLLAAIIIAYTSGALAYSGATQILLVGGILVMIVTTAMFGRQQFWRHLMGAVAIFVSIVGLIEAVKPFPRYDASADSTVQGFVASVSIVMVLAILVLIARAFRIGTIRTRLVISFVVVAVIPLAVQGGVNYYFARQVAVEDANHRLMSAATQTATTIDSFINSNLDAISNESRLQQFSDYLALSPADRQTNQDLRQQVYLLLGTLKNKSIRALSIVQRSQLYVLSYALADRDGTVLASTAPNVGQSVANLEYFRTPLNSGTAYVSQVLFTPEVPFGSLYFTAPVKGNSGEVLGVLIGRYNASLLQLLVERSAGQAGDESFPVLFDSNYLRLADSEDQELVFKLTVPLAPDSVTQLQNIGRLPFQTNAELATNLPDFEKILNTAETQPYFVGSPHPDPTLDQGAIVRPSTQPQWYVVYLQTQSVFLTPIDEQIRGTLFLALAIAVIAATAGVGASRLLARPIVNLTAAAEKVTAGDLALQAPVESNDEVGRLAMAFNSMTAQLRALIGSLEGRVAARTEQLRASADVGRAAASSLNSEQLLAEVVKLITDRFGFYYAAIFTLDPSGRDAVLREATGEAGRILKERGHRLEVGGQSMVGAAIMQRHAHIALDTGAEAVRFANPLLPNTRSEIALPLIVGDQVLGALDVQSTTEAAFDENNATVLQAMADQVAVALNNAVLFAQARQSAQQARTMYQASRLVGQSQGDVEQTIQAMMNMVGTELGYTRWWIATLDEARELLTPLGSPGQTVRVADQPNGPAVRSALYGEPLIVNDPAHDPRVQSLPAERRVDIGKFVSAPIFKQDKPIGVLMLSRGLETADMHEGDLGIANSLANMVLFVIESRTLNAQTQQALAELDRANRRLTGEAWSDFTQRRSSSALRWISTTDRTSQPDWPEVDTAISSGQITTRSLNNGQLGVAVPITLRDVPIGAVRLMISQQTWNDDVRAVLESIAGHVAQAAENARLLDQTERNAQRERAISGAADKIHRAMSMDTVLQTAIAEINRITGLAGVSIQLGFSESAAAEGNGHGATH